jgi:DNA-binding transcriptional ArsR family regulator
MLFSLMDGHARTGTELAIVGEVTPSTASVHVKRLVAAQLVTVFVQGKHRYYSLASADVASALEHLSVVAIGALDRFVPRTPDRLRAARTCYDHLAGAVGVGLHDRLAALRWIAKADDGGRNYEVTPAGERALGELGIDIGRARALRRRLACACLDWSERRPHLGGALGAALLEQATKRRWVVANRHDRALEVTSAGWRELRARFGLTAFSPRV